jgi:hypothetical protein
MVQNLVSHDIFPNKLFPDEPGNICSLAGLGPRRSIVETQVPPDDLDI